jgi:hypothetical protein
MKKKALVLAITLTVLTLIGCITNVIFNQISTYAQVESGGNLYYFQGYDDEQLTVTTSTVVQCTDAKLNGGGSNKTTRAYFSVETNDIRYWYGEGVAGAPTTSNGIKVPAGSSFQIFGYENINSLGMIYTYLQS